MSVISQALTQAVARAGGGIRKHRSDVFVCLVLAVLTSGWVFAAQQLLEFTIENLDLWFDSDSAFVFRSMTDRYFWNHDWSSRHPFEALITSAPVLALMKLGVSPKLAAMPILVASSSLFLIGMYILLRLMGKPIRAALLFTALLAATAPGVLFMGIHERHIIAADSVLLFLIALRLHQSSKLPIWLLTGVTALTFGITLSNGLWALIGLPLALGLERAYKVLAHTFVVVVVLNVAVQAIFPAAQPMFGLSVQNLRTQELLTIQNEKVAELGGTPADRASVLLLDAFVLPRPEVRHHLFSERGFLSVQKSGLTGQSPLWYACAVVWLALLARGGLMLGRELFLSRAFAPSGLAKVVREGVTDPFPWILSIGTLAQLMLFMVWGQETILFAPYFVPALVLIAAWGWKPGAINLATLALLIVLAWSNGAVFMQSLALARPLLGI